MKKIFFICFTLFIAGSGFAQHSSKAYQKLADSLFEYHNYQHAATYYEKAIKKSEQPGNIMLHVARCNSKMNKMSEAEQWYKKAKDNHTTFKRQDTYDFAQTLLALNKRSEAEATLREHLNVDPGAHQLRKLLDDIEHVEKYYKDSATYYVTSLPINTAEAEFAPAYYKDGIVFSSSQPQSFSKKKYHWDNSNFLNLYYSKSVNEQLQKPELFQKELDSRFHDGPAVFYDGYERMIVNRNRAVQAPGKTDTWIWHLSLYDAQQSKVNGTWELNLLPFDEPPYSLAHPSISEDGNVLYFVSDKPGGYGGTDIYRATKINGTWSKPFNLGPTINTPGNEVFPFFNGSTLYFASNGHGGLGGLDIFKSVNTINGFTPPQNMGFPINSNADDFAFITKGDEQNGYFSSSRNGNDDLFDFYKRAEIIKMLAHVSDAVTKEPLPGTTIKLMTSTNEDKELIADSAGYVHFQLSKESAYVLIGDKDGKTGMITGFALPEEDHQHITHPVALLGDTTRIVCIGTIANEFGQTQNASAITIYDETTGKKIEHGQQKSLVNFLGEKGHSYRVEIQNEHGDVTIHQLSIQPDESSSKTWNMVLKKSILTLRMAARVFNAENNQPLAGATVKIITFSEPDQELTANNDGIVEFILTEGTAYVVLGSKDNLNGMHTGVAEQGTEKSSVIHPVPAHGDPVSTLPVVALITDDKGEILNDATVVVTEKTTGESVPAEITDGVVSFFGEREKVYDIKVESNGYQTTHDEVTISKDVTVVDKMSLILERKFTPSPVTYPMTARVFKEEDNSPLADAEVVITTFTEPDKELIADKDGLIDFSLSEGSAYIILASKDGYHGMYTGVAEKGSDNSTIIHPVSTKLNSEKQVPVMAQVPVALNSELTADNLTVTEKSSGEIIPAELSNGILNFYGDTGETYTITIKDQALNRPIVQDITIPVEQNQIKKVALSLGGNDLLQSPGNSTTVSANNASENHVPMVGRITDTNGDVISNAIVTVTDKTTGEKIPVQYKDGLLSFYGEKGKNYSISVEENNHQFKTEEVSVPIETSMPGKISITLEKNKLPSYQMAARVFRSEDNTALAGANITITSFNDFDTELIADSLGIADFTMTEGSAFIIFAHKDEYHGMYSGVVEKGTDKSSVIHPVSATKQSEQQVPVVAQLTTNNTALHLSEEDVTVTEKSSGEIMPAQLSNGLLSFYGDKGEAYTITIEDQDKHRTEEVVIGKHATGVQKISLVENEEEKLISLTMAVHVFRADNQSSLSDADVKIISFSEPDQEFTTNTDGISDFSLPEGTAFVAVGTINGYTGMYTGIAELEPEKDKAIYPIPVYAMQENQVQVVGFARSENGKQLSPTQVQVTNKRTGEEVPAQNQNGLLSFVGEKGNTYNIQVSAEGYDAFAKEITLDNASSIVKSFTMSIPENNTMPVSSTLIVLNADGNTSRFYISSSESHSEILERDGNLYLLNGSTEKKLDQGSLAEFKEDPAAYLKNTGLSFDDVITLQNIYFDYNKALLDEVDKKELDKAKTVLQRYSSLKLTIGAHADDRGDDKYNLNLSKRRAKAVESYLIKKGIKPDHIFIHAYGESVPAIPCSANCSEDDHQKNRRAEFTLQTTMATALPMTNDKVKSTSRINSSDNKALLEKYGNKEIEGLSFKINIGAYRHNHSLTFDNLKDLGTVEKDHENGITYYYLASYSTLQSARSIRQQVIERGIKDAFISIFSNDQKISFTTFVSMAE